MYIGQTHLREWVQAGRATIVTAEVAQEFADYIESLPWLIAGTYPAWDRIPHATFRWDGLEDDEVAARATNAKVARHGHLLALYTLGEPALLVRYEDGIRNIDELYWRAPGPRYMCGADWDDAELTLCCGDFLEYDGGGQLRFTL